MSMWHYNQSGRQRGPIELGELTAEISAGNITGDTLVWEVGTKDWIVLKDHPELGATNPIGNHHYFSLQNHGSVNIQFPFSG